MIIWFFLGLLTNVYYFYKKHNEYTSLIKEGKITVKSLIIGFILTTILFPIAIYNNEIRRNK